MSECGSNKISSVKTQEYGQPKRETAGTHR